jgi:hypothetical protein
MDGGNRKRNSNSILSLAESALLRVVWLFARVARPRVVLRNTVLFGLALSGLRSIMGLALMMRLDLSRS